jgi:transcription elongation factor Elf1
MEMNPRHRYIFDLKCPHCGRQHMQWVGRDVDREPRIYCLQCLKAGREKIEFEIVRVTVDINGADR